MEEINELKKELIELSLKVGEHYRVKFDFSIDSIKQVEDILRQINSEYSRNQQTEGLNGLTLELAAYIIAVIEKNITIGTWQRNSVEFGKDIFPYDLGGGNIIYPYQWCQKRIYDGESENVWTKFEALVLNKTKSN